MSVKTSLTDAGQSGVEAQEDDACVSEHTADDNQVVELRTGHFYVPLVAIFDVDCEKNRCHHDSANGTSRQNGINGFIHASVLDYQERLVFRGLSGKNNNKTSNTFKSCALIYYQTPKKCCTITSN